MVEVFGLGGFRVETVDESGDRHSRKRALIFLYLALKLGRPVQRREMAADLWPDAPEDARANRLRVGLARMRADFGDVVSEGREGLVLDLSKVSFDLVKVRDELTEALDHADPADEREALESLLPWLRLRLVPEIREPWTEGAQESWGTEAGDACYRLVELAIAHHAWDSVMAAAEAGLIHEVRKEAFIEASLKARTATLGPEAGWDYFVDARRRQMEERGVDFSAELVTLAKDIRSRKILVGKDQSGLSVEAKTFLGEAVALLLEKDIRRARMVLGSDFVRNLSVHFMVEATEVYSHVVAEVDTEDEAWMHCASTAVDLWGMRYHWANVLDIAAKAIELAPESLVKVNLLRQAGFANFVIRNWDLALAQSEEARDMAERLGEVSASYSCSGSVAATLLHLAEFDRARLAMKQTIDFYGETDAMRAQSNAGVCEANTGLTYIMEGEYETALQYLQSAENRWDRHSLTVFRSMAWPMVGILRAETGDVKGAIQVMIDGLKLAYGDSSRVQQIGLEFAAGLLTLGKDDGFARRLLDWVDVWRGETKHTRSPGELMYVQRYYERGQTGHSSLLNRSVRDVFRLTIRKLREMDKRLR